MRRMRNLEQQQSTNCTAANRKFSLRDTQLFLFIYSSVQFSFVKKGNSSVCVVEMWNVFTHGTLVDDI